MERTNPDHTKLQLEVEALDQVMLRLSWVARKQLAQELEHFRLTVPQYVTLRALCRTETGCTMRELAEAAQQLSPTMTGIVDRLHDAQLVQRLPDPSDRRLLRVILTEQGRRIMDAIEQQRLTRLTQVVSNLEPQERQDLIRLMQRYVNATLSESVIKTK